MTMTRLVKKIPYVTQVLRRLNQFRSEHVIRRITASRCRHAEKIGQALSTLQQPSLYSAEVHEWQDKIEYERTRLLSQTESFVDGRFGKPGIYDDGLSVAEACKASKPDRQAIMLFLLVRQLKSKNVIELGTNVGISSAYLGAGLQENQEAGKITSLDSSPYRQQVAREVHQNLNIDNVSLVTGLFSETLTATLKSLGEVDLAFIDGHHQYQSTMDFYNQIFEFSSSDAVFIFDDITYNQGMKRAWSEIKRDDRLELVVDLSAVGVCSKRQDTNDRRYVSPRLYLF